MKDTIDYLGWKLNYNGDKSDGAWIDNVQHYIKYLESTINTLQGTLELSGVSPKEVSDGEVVQSCLEYLEDVIKYKSETGCFVEGGYIDMEERLLNL